MKFEANLTAAEIKRLVRSTLDSMSVVPEDSKFTLIFSIAKGTPLSEASKSQVQDYLKKILVAVEVFGNDENFRFNLTMPMHNSVEDALVAATSAKFEAAQALAAPPQLQVPESKLLLK